LSVVVFNCVNPETLNVDKIVVLFDFELYELISYKPELFIIKVNKNKGNPNLEQTWFCPKCPAFE
jgi:hypothetical protein